MKARTLRDGIEWVGVIDWDRRVFDSLVPLPDGTSYNAWVVRGAERTALIDTVEPRFTDQLLARLADAGIDRIDYVVANHAEQDHSGSLPAVLERFPGARVVCTKRAVRMLSDLMDIPADAFMEADNGGEIDLGGRTLRFIHFPWVHWPETMLTWAPEDRVLFSCDLFGSHLATNELVSRDAERVHTAAKLYYAEIMMPFRKIIAKNLDKVRELPISVIAPSHGPAWDQPEGILDAYSRWIGDGIANEVALPFISMHDSTRRMVEHLIDALTDRNVRVRRIDLETIDVGRLASALVDAGTIVIGTPTVLGGPHPNVMYAAYLAGLLQPKATTAAVIGSFGWAGKTVEAIVSALDGLDCKILDPVLARGMPGADEFAALDTLAETIARRHIDQNAQPGCA